VVRVFRNFSAASGVIKKTMNDQPRQGASLLSRIFVSSNGIRVGWLLAIFLVLYSALTLGAQFAFATIPVLRLWAASQPHGVITPIGQIAFSGLELIILLTCVTLVSKVERRSLAAGPVGSVFAFAVFALAGLMIHLSFRYSPALASTRQE
jgi:hypothetical protein